MGIWKRSKLTIGEELKIPKSLFIEPDKALTRLTSVKYVGETDAGIIIDCSFTPAFGTTDPDKYHYKMMISWANIWCGKIKILLTDGSPLRAVRINNFVEV